MDPFYETARLLYEGPWVAERYLAAKCLIESSPELVHPVTRQIISVGGKVTAADAFATFYRLEELRRLRDRTFRSVDALALPTAPTVYTIEQVLADPIALNNTLGTYTNFVNLLDLCGLAVPALMRPTAYRLVSRCSRPPARTSSWLRLDGNFITHRGSPSVLRPRSHRPAHAASIKVTGARRCASLREKRTQVCIWRPTLPGAGAR